MIIRFILKLWPAFTPILFYLFWVLVIERFVIKRILKKKTIIEGEKVVGEKSTAAKKISNFSLENRRFVIVLYLSFLIAIASLIITALSSPVKDFSSYTPAQYKDGKIIPPTIR
jgi:hypothetical protein